MEKSFTNSLGPWVTWSLIGNDAGLALLVRGAINYLQH